MIFQEEHTFSDEYYAKVTNGHFTEYKTKDKIAIELAAKVDAEVESTLKEADSELKSYIVSDIEDFLRKVELHAYTYLICI